MTNHSAQIIPFPRAPRQPAAPATPLVAAMTGLAAALAEQKQAVATWRSAITVLDQQVKTTQHGLRAQQTTLGTLRGRVSRLQEQAGELGRWAAMASVAK